MKICRILLLFITLFSTARALELSNIFSDHMVLQQAADIRVWGKAQPGASVQVSFAGQDVSTQADPRGEWSLILEPLEASFEGRTMTVKSGSDTRTFQDVLVGEVWLGSGQSNMEWSVNISNDGDFLKLAANDPHLRLYQVRYNTSTEPEFSSQAVWAQVRPQNAGWFSAVAYQFGRDLRETLNVPVGIIQSAVGGTPAIAWTRSSAFPNHELLVQKQNEWEQRLSTYDADLSAWEQAYDKWLLANGVSDPKRKDYRKNSHRGAPSKPRGPDSSNRPANLVNAMIAPIVPYTISGVIWYQGEADTRWAPEFYGQRLHVMIDDWRAWWKLPKMPFGVVQLANLGKASDQPTDGSWEKLRESQRKLAASDDNIGMVVTIDIGEANDIHPTDKFTVARRLARWALTDVYSKLSLAGGPQIVSATAEPDAILLTFDQTGKGLRMFDGHSLGGFTVSGAKGPFVKVSAKIINKTQVRLSTKGITEPKTVRYAWQQNPADANLTNIERLPASPFEIKVD